MSFSEWLDRWGRQHPVQAPAPDPEAFTEAVMRRLAEPAVRPWRLPRLAWAAAFAAAAVLVVPRLLPVSTGRLAAAIQQEAEVLAALGEPIEEDLSDEAFAAFLLAEAAPSDDEAWLAETMQLLEQLDESLPDDESTDEEWLRELESLDAAGASASS